MLPSTLLTTTHQRRHQHGSRSEKAYQELKRKIVTLELPPATVLTETVLMEDLGIGRTPVREALQRLSHEDLVVILPRRGIIVADLNVSDLQKIFEIRVELESFAVRLAAVRALPKEISEMDALFATADEIIEHGEHHQLIVLDHQAHRLLARATHNPFLEDTLEQLYTHVLRLWYVSLHKVSRLREAIQEHCDIIEALKEGDGERGAEIMSAHIIGFQTEFEITSN